MKLQGLCLTPDCQPALGDIHERFAGRGQGKTSIPPYPLKQQNSQFLFQQLQPFADGRLRQMQLFRRLTDIAGPGDRHKSLDIVMVHFLSSHEFLESEQSKYFTLLHE